MSFDFLLETLATERLKTLSVWSQFQEADLEFRPANVARSVREQLVHQCLSEDAWFTRMLGIAVSVPALPRSETRRHFMEQYAEASAQRLARLASRPVEWFGLPTTFFSVQRSHAWVLVRRIAHTAHHRGQLTTYHRLLGHVLYSTYGPTADTGGLPANGGVVVYRYSSGEAMLTGVEGAPPIAGAGQATLTERPLASG